MTELWPHQRAAVDFIAPLGRGMLAMDMGTGKTLAALALLEEWGCKRVLILCPKSVVSVWPQEFQKHTGQTWRVVPLEKGSVGKRTQKLTTALLCSEADQRPCAVILNYDAVIHKPLGPNKKEKGVLVSTPWDCVIMDESHRIKSPGGKQSLVVSQIARNSEHPLGLTGTPMPHSPLDVYAQFRAIDPRVFGYRFDDFRERYAVMEERSRWIPERNGQRGRRQTYHEITGYQNLGELHDRMYTATYRVTSDEVLDLPDVMDVERYCLLAPKAKRIYDALETDLIAEIESGLVTAQNALTQLLRLAQVANGFAVDAATNETHQVGTEKAELLADVLEDLPGDEPLVVFCRFHNDLDTVHGVVAEAGRTSCELSGRRNELAAWQAGETNVLVAQLQAGGLGVDLTRARYQVYFALDFNLGSYLQTRKRIHRPGQTRNVTYIHLIAAGTVDDRVYAALAQREQVVTGVLNGLIRQAA